LRIPSRLVHPVNFGQVSIRYTSYKNASAFNPTRESVRMLFNVRL